MDRLLGPGFILFTLLFSTACGEEEATEPPTLPPASTPVPTPYPDTTPFPGGVISPGGDATPVEAVQITEIGRWVMSPPGGPYDAMSGELTFIEAPVGATEEDAVFCTRVFSLSGSLIDANTSGCPGCGIVLQVQHFQSESIGECSYPDVPNAGDIRSLGFHQGEGLIYFYYKASGSWLPWYDANRQSDVIEFEWTDTFGYLNPEEEP